MEHSKQLWVGKSTLMKGRFTPANNNGNIAIKGGGGLWTSTFINKEHGSSWIQWCLSENFSVPNDKIWKGYILTLKDDLKIYRIDTLKDMHELFDKYGYNYIPNSTMEGIDFEKMSEDYDGIHLTEHGQSVTRHGTLFHHFEGDLKEEWKEKSMRTFYGWDCESTFHFKWNFQKIEKVTINAKYSVEESIEALFGN